MYCHLEMLEKPKVLSLDDDPLDTLMKECKAIEVNDEE